MTILVSGLVLAAYYSAPFWVLGLLGGAAGLTLGVFLFFYIYFGFTNPDALRSERFTLSKMAIEKNLVGDNLAGFIATTAQDEFTTITAKEVRTDDMG